MRKFQFSIWLFRLFRNACEKQHFCRKVCNANFWDLGSTMFGEPKQRWVKGLNEVSLDHRYKHFDAILGEVFIFSSIFLFFWAPQNKGNLYSDQAFQGYAVYRGSILVWLVLVRLRSPTSPNKNSSYRRCPYNPWRKTNFQHNVSIKRNIIIRIYNRQMFLSIET